MMPVKGWWHIRPLNAEKTGPSVNVPTRDFVFVRGYGDESIAEVVVVGLSCSFQPAFCHIGNANSTVRTNKKCRFSR